MVGEVGVYSFPEEETPELEEVSPRDESQPNPDIDRETLDSSIEIIRSNEAAKTESPIYTEIGFDLSSLGPLLDDPAGKADIAEHVIRNMMFPRWIDFWAGLQPVKGLTSPELTAALEESAPFKYVGARPKSGLSVYAQSYKEQAEEAVASVLELAKSFEDKDYVSEIMQGRIPPELRSSLQEIIDDLVKAPAIRDARRAHRALLDRYPDATVLVPDYSALDRHYRSSHRHHNASVLYSSALNQSPTEAQKHAHYFKQSFALDLNTVKKGVTLDKSISTPNQPTQPVRYIWKDILELLPYTDVVIVNADPAEALQAMRGFRRYLVDEFTQIVKNKETHLATMLKAIKQHKYKGRIIIQMPVPYNGIYRANEEITKAAIFSYFIQDFFNPTATLAK